ncbi:MAG: hypothetical protein HY695_16325 [Deltaproteobacteria bacterium]|nr:hypothetical protein [Deltaproteobacteria bacterium]
MTINLVKRALKNIVILGLTLFFALGVSCPSIASPVPERGCSHHGSALEEGGCKLPIFFCEFGSMSSGEPVLVRANGPVQIAQLVVCQLVYPNPPDEFSLTTDWLGASQYSKADKIPVHLYLSVLII